MVSQRGIEVNPDKIQAKLNMEPPKNVKEVQSLTGRVAALNRFISKATDKCLPFFRVLKKAFEWTDECQWAFKDLKVYLTSTPLLSPSEPSEELYLYLTVSPHAVSSALIREEGKTQKPIYYTRKALKWAKGQYPPREMLAFLLVKATRKLRPYFQAYIINVLTDHSLKKAMTKLKVVGRLIQWTIKLSKFDIRYRPREAIKTQALAEFTPTHDQQNRDWEEKEWFVNVDGLSSQHARGIGVVLQSLEGGRLEYVVCL